jgi:hypothetical protein
VITFVQQNSNAPFTNIASISSTYASAAQVAGDLNVVIISWEESAGSVLSVVDTGGNTYTAAVGPTVISGIASQTIYYAKNIHAAAAGANTVTITFAAAVPHPDLRILEYGGLDATSPFDVGRGSMATSGTLTNSGVVTTTSANELLVGANVIAHSTTGPGAGYTSRVITAHADIAEDMVVSATGSYSATAPTDMSGWWVMQIATFRSAAGGGAPYPPSTILGGISWNEASKQRYAGGTNGSDIWDSTWASDGQIYSGWGDGIGFNATSKVQMGISRLSGTPDSPPVTGLDTIDGAVNPPECPGFTPSTLGGKPEGMVALPSGLMYLHHSVGTATGGGSCSNSWLAKSTDNGVTWTDHVGGIQWPDANGFSPVGFLQYGQAQAGALIPDNTGTPYIYIYGSKGAAFAHQMFLARVPASPVNAIETLANWQYFGVPAANGDPNWVSSSATASAVWTDLNNADSIVVTFDKAMGRYIAYDDHGSGFERQVGLFDGPSPWGPWTTFDYEEQFDNTGCGTNCLGNGEAVSFQLMQKWMSADGLTAWANYSSTGNYDSLNLIKGTMSLASGSTIKQLALSSGKPAVLDRLSSTNSGNLEYIDRTYRLTSIGPYAGLEAIRLPNNDKAVNVTNYVSLTMTVQQNVCVAWDSLNALPSWLSTWAATGNNLIGNTTFNVYRKLFPAGPVSLPGPNSSDNYILFVGCP